MYKGIYIAMSGAMLRRQEFEIIANNLANVNTVGFKRSTFSSRLYPLLEGVQHSQNVIYPEARAMAYFGRHHIDVSDGSIKTTGNPLDVAIRGDGFFAVESRGGIYYTRNGSFTIDRDGYLVTMVGQRVLDIADNPIRIIGDNVIISSDGMIHVDGNAAGQLKLIGLDNILKEGGSLFSGDEVVLANAEVFQGSIEMSNVNPIHEMVSIMIALRQYESARKMIQKFDDLSRKAVTEIARIRQ